MIATASLIAMGQASSKKIVEANEFVLRDDSGNIRAKLSMSVHAGAAPGYPASPQLVLFDEKAMQRVQMDGDAFIPGLTLYDNQGRDRGRFHTGLDSAVLVFQDEHGRPITRLKEGELATVEINAGQVHTVDADGFEAVLGGSELVTQRTGETHKTSAASLVLFDKNKNVIWKAP